MSLVSQFPHSAQTTFLSDLNRLVDMFEELDREYGIASEDFAYNKPICDKYIEAFDNKYKGLRAAYSQTGQTLRLRIMINEKSLSKIFDEALSKIGGLVSAGKRSFDEVSAGDETGLKHIVSMAKSGLRLKYAGYEKNSIVLQKENLQDLPEIHLLAGEKVRSNTPEGELLTYYGLVQGGDMSINLREISNSFCYTVRGVSGKDKNPGFFN